jgi:hypothetical protein
VPAHSSRHANVSVGSWQQCRNPVSELALRLARIAIKYPGDKTEEDPTMTPEQVEEKVTSRLCRSWSK